MENGIKIICVNGAPGSGKTTIENLCCDMLKGHGKIASTVDFVKKVALYAGWNGQKDLKGRKLLSDLKDILTEYNDIPIKQIEKEIRVWKDELENFGINLNNCVMFCDVREPSELQKMKNYFNARCVLIRRPSVENLPTSNHADANINLFDYDYVLINDCKYLELEEKCNNLLNWIFNEN